MAEQYYSKDSSNTDMERFSSYVDVTIYQNHIEGVGVSYVRHFKTIPELEKELEELKKLPLSQDEYEKRKESLENKVLSRRRPYTSRTYTGKTKADNLKSVKKSQRKMLSYLYANFDVPFALAATLTYMEKVFDIKVAKNDFKNFKRKFSRKFPNATWIAIYEYHNDGSIHIHLVFKNAKGATHEVLTKMWGHGLAFVKQMNPEAIPYFCKNERLEMYPSRTRIFSKSENCKEPRKVKMTVDQFVDLTKDMECTYTKAKTLYIKSSISEKAKQVNHYIYKNFKKRKDD